MPPSPSNAESSPANTIPMPADQFFYGVPDTDQGLAERQTTAARLMGLGDPEQPEVVTDEVSAAAFSTLPDATRENVLAIFLDPSTAINPLASRVASPSAPQTGSGSPPAAGGASGNVAISTTGNEHGGGHVEQTRSPGNILSTPVPEGTSLTKVIRVGSLALRGVVQAGNEAYVLLDIADKSGGNIGHAMHSHPGLQPRRWYQRIAFAATRGALRGAGVMDRKGNMKQPMLNPLTAYRSSKNPSEAVRNARSAAIAARKIVVLPRVIYSSAKAGGV